MGLFSFVKNAGAKIFGKKKEEETTDRSVDGTAPEVNQAEIDAQKAVEIENLIKGLGFDVQDLYVEVNDDLVTIHGETSTWEDKEKTVLAAGNVEGIAEVDDRIAYVAPEPVEIETEEESEASDRSVPASPQASEYYTVKKGDSLSKIAKRFYGDPLKYPAIFEANKPLLGDVNLIYPGQKLRIPPVN